MPKQVSKPLLCALLATRANGGGMNIPGGESWPSITGLNADYLYKQMKDVKDGSRNSPTMMPFVNMLNDQQFKDIAVYYSQLPAVQGQGDPAAYRRRVSTW